MPAVWAARQVSSGRRGTGRPAVGGTGGQARGGSGGGGLGGGGAGGQARGGSGGGGLGGGGAGGQARGGSGGGLAAAARAARLVAVQAAAVRRRRRGRQRRPFLCPKQGSSTLRCQHGLQYCALTSSVDELRDGARRLRTQPSCGCIPLNFPTCDACTQSAAGDIEVLYAADRLTPYGSQ